MRWQQIKRAILSGWWATLRRNGFVYNASCGAGVRLPSIAVRPVECYGQCGEDLIVASMLEAIALKTGTELKDVEYLEIGGNHPFATSTTYLLHKQLGMRGVIVEANPNLIPDLEKGRPADTIIHAAIHEKESTVAVLSLSAHDEVSSLDRKTADRWHELLGGGAEELEVPAMRINELMRLHVNDTAPAFMSIDVEGLDLALLKEFDFARYRPWLIQIEYMDNVFPPGNGKEIVAHMQNANYSLVAKTYINLIFAEASLLTRLGGRGS
jgi:FkbM family methyltransferase